VSGENYSNSGFLFVKPLPFRSRGFRNSPGIERARLSSTRTPLSLETTIDNGISVHQFGGLAKIS